MGPILCSLVSQRRCARLLGVNPKTIARRIPYLAAVARREVEQRRQERKGAPLARLYLDELITFEHTRCKPLAVCAVVSPKREILSFRVSTMPAIGRHLKQISLRKYGKRANERASGVRHCLEEVRPFVGPETVVISDEEPSYGRVLADLLPDNRHQTFPSKRAVIAGQGELKDRSFDPLFPINHTFAMLRGNLACLVRRTWTTTKKKAALTDRLWIYLGFHNHELLAQAS